MRQRAGTESILRSRQDPSSTCCRRVFAGHSVGEPPARCASSAARGEPGGRLRLAAASCSRFENEARVLNYGYRGS